MYFVYIENGTNEVKFMIETDKDFDYASNLNENLFCIQLENKPNINLLTNMYKYDGTSFIDLGLIPVPPNVYDRMSALEELFLSVMGVQDGSLL